MEAIQKEECNSEVLHRHSEYHEDYKTVTLTKEKLPGKKGGGVIIVTAHLGLPCGAMARIFYTHHAAVLKQLLFPSMIQSRSTTMQTIV